MLLDTCAAIWIAEDEDLSAAATAAIERSFEEGHAVRVSPITAWEIGLLIARGRIASTIAPKVWFARFLATANIGLAEMSADILIDSSSLPGLPPRDPADRIIIATARELGLAVITRDRSILDYAEAGHVTAIAC